MEVRIDPHTLERAEERGTNEEEIRSQYRVPHSSKHGRLGRAKIFDFRQSKHGRFLEQKWVEVFYASEEVAVVTVTVYVFYGRWEGP